MEGIADFRLELDEMGGQFRARRERFRRIHTRVLPAVAAAGVSGPRRRVIAGGSTFIQRNIIVERILSMPKG